MIKFMKPKLLVEEKDGKKIPKLIINLSLFIAKNLNNCKPLRMVELGTKAESCFIELFEMTREEKEFHQSCLRCCQVLTALIVTL